MRIAALTLLLALALAAPAAAQAPSLTLEAAGDRAEEYGEEHRLTGRLTQGGAPVPGQVVVLEARPFPYTDPFAPVGTTTTTDDAGRFRARVALDRNHDVRASVPALGALSRRLRVFVYPRTELSYSVVRTNVVRLTQTYATPRDVRLSEPTLFYLSRRGARRAPLRARARVRRTRPGRFVSRVTVRLPRSYRGRFQYASCFDYDAAEGMGDPAARCGRFFRFD